MKNLFKKGRALVAAAAIALSALAASIGVSTAPAQAATQDRPNAGTTVRCFYMKLPQYYWSVYKAGTYCPPTNTAFIQGAFRTGTLYDRLIVVTP